MTAYVPSGYVLTAPAGAPPVPPTPPVALDPYTSPDAFGQMQIGPVRVAGVIQAITGADLEWTWDAQKGTSTSGVTSVYKGDKPAESIKVKASLPDSESFADLEVFKAAVIPPKGQKATGYDCTNGVLNLQRIFAVEIKKIGQPTESSPGAGDWEYELELGQYSPATPVATGAASSAVATPLDPSAAGAPGASAAAAAAAPPAAKDAASQQIAALLKQAQQ